MTDDHGGLAYDLSALLERRRALKLLAGLGLVAMVGCGDDDTATGEPTTTPSGRGSSGECSEIPQETAGPFPGDGTNGPDVLGQSGVVRRDITSSFGSSSGKADGVPLTVNLAVLDAGRNCAAMAGAAVYVWHCTADGLYSLYSRGAAGENFLRGVQIADANGRVTFKTIFPGAYAGRWPHIHFEVFPDEANAAGAAGKVATSQLALPQDACEEVYATGGLYRASVRNLAQTSLERDNVFRDDGGASQLATVAGDPESGYTAELAVRVNG